MNITRLPTTLFAPEPFAFDEPFRALMRPFRWEAPADTPQIHFEITEADDVYTVRADMPGVRKEDIHVEIDGAQVMITAELKKESPAVPAKEARVLHTERRYGFMSRMFTLGQEIDRARAAAKYLDGVLTLTLPKKVSAHTEPLVVQ
jgi:HSP20 family protein